MAPDWIKACKESKRYDEFNWNEQVEVEVDTLDSLIKKYGRPEYLKIDVEGNEYNVLKGLSCGVPLVSLEICPETMSSTQNCINYLSSIIDMRFNLSSGETALKFDLPEWITATEMVATLKGSPRFGYLWARLTF